VPALITDQAAPPSGAELLSPRERQILLMVARGGTSAAIGQSLHLSPKTVDTYRSRLMAKLGLTDVAAIVRWAIREGLVDVGEG
jgi:two-component system, NarL family, invasion response regulator UvrY